MIKVTHVITGLAADGAERALLNLVRRMNREKFESEVVSLTNTAGLGDEFESSGVRVHALNMRKSIQGVFSPVRLAHWLRASNPDVVQTWMYHS
ncbi:MAG: glycosyltransferase, partial [Acidobacteriia bacterium]|nr:glycosyltransferase [Terriglobia bacterium]